MELILVDLPGLIHNGDDVDAVHAMVESFVEKPQTLILLVAEAKQDKELEHPSKRQKSVIDVESSEWKVQSAVVSWLRGHIEIKKQIRKKIAETSTQLNNI